MGTSRFLLFPSPLPETVDVEAVVVEVVVVVSALSPLLDRRPRTIFRSDAF